MVDSVILARKEYDTLIEKVKFIDKLQDLDDKYVIIQGYGCSSIGMLPKIVTHNKEEIILDILSQMKAVNDKYQKVLDAYEQYKIDKKQGLLYKVINKFLKYE